MEAGGNLRLKVASGNAEGSLIAIEDEFLIGRQAAGAGTLGQDIEISRQHARIDRGADGRYLIEDLGSKNGTWVNGRRIESPTALEVGDRIEVGGSTLVVQIGALPGATPPAGTEVSDLPAEVAAEGARDTAPEPEAPPAAGVALRVDIDLDALEVTVSVEEGADVVKLRYEEGRWRLR
jgi:predicted component of type VI protein secretion system